MSFFRKHRTVKRSYTLVEIIVSMSIFALLMLIVMQIFNSMQNLWSSTAARTQTYQNARTILDAISADLQNAYYNEKLEPSSSWVYYSDNGKFDSDATGSGSSDTFWVVTERQPSVQTAVSSLVESCFWTETVSKDSLTLLRLKNGTLSSVDVGNYNFYKTSEPPDKSSLRDAFIMSDNIVSLSIRGFDRTGTVITEPKQLPYLVWIELKMLDDTPEVRTQYLQKSTEDRQNMVRTFSRVIKIPSRGQ